MEGKSGHPVRENGPRLVMKQPDNFFVLDVMLLLSNDKLIINVADLQTMKTVVRQSLHECIGHLNISRLPHALNLAQKLLGFGGMFEYM